MISRAKSSEQNDDKTNNSDDVILRQYTVRPLCLRRQREADA